MTEAEIDTAILEVLKDKELKKKLEIGKREAYYLKNGATVMKKLDVLWRANKLRLK